MQNEKFRYRTFSSESICRFQSDMNKMKCILQKNCKIILINVTISGPKMSGNFVNCKHERQRMFTYIICKQYTAAHAYTAARACGAQNFQTFLGRL